MKLGGTGRAIKKMTHNDNGQEDLVLAGITEKLLLLRFAETWIMGQKSV